MCYTICLTNSAEKSLSKLPSDVQTAVATTISSLKGNFRSLGVKKLCQQRNLHRISCKKDYRVIFTIDDESHVITVKWIRHRREAYRHL